MHPYQERQARQGSQPLLVRRCSPRAALDRTEIGLLALPEMRMWAWKLPRGLTAIARRRPLSRPFCWDPPRRRRGRRSRAREGCGYRGAPFFVRSAQAPFPTASAMPRSERLACARPGSFGGAGEGGRRISSSQMRARLPTSSRLYLFPSTSSTTNSLPHGPAFPRPRRGSQRLCLLWSGARRVALSVITSTRASVFLHVARPRALPSGRSRPRWCPWRRRDRGP